jgi:SAM-dependent methyltransferase
LPVDDDPYRDFAEDYHWLYGDTDLTLGTRTPGVRLALTGLAPGARVLDAACGIGIDAAALTRRGFDVTVADASRPMLDRALAHLDAVVPGHRTTCVHSAWEDLPQHLRAESFDAVLCTGNSIAHLRDSDEMTDAFRSFAALLRPGGMLVLDTHDWEQIEAAGERALVDRETIRHGRRCRRRYIWRRSDDASGALELTFELDVLDGPRPGVRRHTVVLHPFSRPKLRSRLEVAGFRRVAIDAVPGHDRYTAVAVRCPT